MIHPQMATMLVYLFTDLAANSSDLKRLLKAACDQTFNCISVDGDTSTNDTLFIASERSELVCGSKMPVFAKKIYCGLVDRLPIPCTASGERWRRRKSTSSNSPSNRQKNSR